MAQNRGPSSGGGAIKNPLFSNVSQSAFLEEFAANSRLIVGVAPPPQASNPPQSQLISATSSGPIQQHETLNSVPLFPHQPPPASLPSQVVSQSLTTAGGVQQPVGSSLPLQEQSTTTFTDVPLTADSAPHQSLPPPAILPNSGPPPLTGYSRVSPLSRYPRGYIQTTQTSGSSGGVNIFAPSLPTVQPKLFTPESQPLDNCQPAFSQLPESLHPAPTGVSSFFTPNVPTSTAPPPFSDAQPLSASPAPPQPSLHRALAAAVSKVFTGSSTAQQPPPSSVPDPQPLIESAPQNPQYNSSPYPEPQPTPAFAPSDSQGLAVNSSGGPFEPSEPLSAPPVTQPSLSLSSFFTPSFAQNSIAQAPSPNQPQTPAPPPSASIAPFQPSPSLVSPVSTLTPTSTQSPISYFQPASQPEVSQPSPFSIFTPSHQATDFSKSHESSINQNSSLQPSEPTSISSSAFASVTSPPSSETHAPSLPSAASFFAPPPTNRDSPFRPIKPTTTPPASSLNSSPSSIAGQGLTRETSASAFFNNIGQQHQTNLFTPTAPPPSVPSESPAAVLPVSTECLIAPSPAVEVTQSALFDGPPPSTTRQPAPPPSTRGPPSSSTVTSPLSSVSHTPPPTYASLGFQNSAGENVVDGQELQQIPLENTVPLYNPKTVGLAQSQPRKDEVHNLYRVAAGLKRPSYVPPPDLPLATNTSAGPERRPSEDMAATKKHQQYSSLGRQSPQTPPRNEDSTGFSTDSGNLAGHYRPAYHHWFFKRGDSKSHWQPFSVADSLNLEHAFSSPDINDSTKVATDGGRYDVEVVKRKKRAVFWEETPSEVRRCSWFVKSSLLDSQYVPYDENIAELLEDEYRAGCLRNEWNRRVELADGEVVIFHSEYAMAHYQRPSTPDARVNPPQMQLNPRIVKRGLEDFEISEGEPTQVDHLMLVVHGIGKVCDLRFRSLVQVVDDFRTMSLQLTQSHFRRACESGEVGRIEILPVEWHQALHTETIDQRLADITLPSIPKAREFTNDTILDVLFYSSPVFCEKIVQAVGAELNRVISLYKERNPSFKGGVSLGGHSLGSLILFDMLSHQSPVSTPSAPPQATQNESEDDEFSDLSFTKTKARLSRRMSYLKIGSLGAGQPFITYPQINFHPKAFFAFGSPIGMFLTVRGVESLGDGFKFPTCPKFFNIFHPNDPVAYRIEALICKEMANVPPVLIPHHKGRKRMHLELKDTMAHVTAALKLKLVESIRSTWNSVYQLAMFQRSDSTLKKEVDQVLDEEAMRDQGDTLASPLLSSNQSVAEEVGLDLTVGSLNGGNRIDYVLQEAPLETFNQYISAIRSHLVYWESEDTALLVLKEIYKTMNISSDSQVAHQIVPFDISRSTDDQYTGYNDSIVTPPTQLVRK